MKLNTKMQQSL